MIILEMNNCNMILTMKQQILYECLQKKCTAKPYPFLVIDLLLHQIVLYISAKIIEKDYEKLIMTIGDKIRDDQLQYNVNREAAKISTLSSVKTYKYGYLTGEEILPSNQRQMLE